MKKVLTFVLITFIFSVSHFSVSAHPGTLDSLGGHFRNADCHYLLHEPTELARSLDGVEEMIVWIQKNSSNSCAVDLTEETIDFEGFTFSSSDEAVNPHSMDDVEPVLLQLGETYSVTLDRCTDGDTARFQVGEETYRTRFLFIDTPESTNQVEPYGREASQFTCQALTEATSIELQLDGRDIFDRYDRLLAWVFVDGTLLQEELAREGLVKSFYDYGDYIYEEAVRSAMEEAQRQKKGLWADNEEVAFPFILYSVIGGMVIVGIGMLRRKRKKRKKRG